MISEAAKRTLSHKSQADETQSAYHRVSHRDNSPNQNRMEQLKERFATQHQEMQLQAQARMNTGANFEAKAQEI